MGLLDSAKNLIKSAYNYFVDDKDKKVDNASKQSTNAPIQKVNKQPVSVIRPNGETVGTVGDEVVKSSKTNETKQNADVEIQKTTQTTAKKTNNKNTVTNNDITNIMNSIEDKCKKFNIAYDDVKNNLLKNLGYTNEKFQELKLEDKYKVLSCIDAALSMQIIYENQDDFIEDIDKTEFLTKVAKNYMDVIETGEISDIKAYQKRIDTALNIAYKKFKNAKTEEAKAEALTELKENINQQTRNDFNIKKKGKSKAEQARLDKKRQQIELCNERNAEYGFYRKAKAEDRKYSVYIRSGKYMDEAVKNAIDVSNSTSKTTVAVSQTHDFINNAVKFKYEHGDIVSADTYGNAIEYSMIYKTAEAAKEFEEAAYEFRQKVESGEIDAPWMNEEYFTAESTAIGVGITSNKNMSSAEKAELLNNWDKHCREFNDYINVKDSYKKAVKEYASENKNTEQGVSNVKTILIEKYSNDIDQMPRAWEKRNQDNSEIKPKASESTLKAELKTKTISEIKKSYSNTMPEIARIILSNDIEYKNRVDDIIDYLDGFSGTDIGFMATGCTTHTISKIIQAFPEKANDILDVVAPTMCYSGKQVVEQIVEKGNNNAAA